MDRPPPPSSDPAREWLGIDRADLADPRRVLGVAADESDPLRVLAAAKARLDLLHGLAAGPRHAARQALVLRVEQARETVLREIAASASPAPTFAMPPPPRRGGEPAGRGIAPPVAADVAVAPEAGLPVIRDRARRPPRRQGSALTTWFSLAAIAACVGLFAAFIWWQGQLEERRQVARGRDREKSERRDAEELPAADDGPRRIDPSGRPGRALPEDALVSTSPPPAPRGTAPRVAASPMKDEAVAPLGSDAALPNDAPPASAAMAATEEAPAEGAEDAAVTLADDGPEASMDAPMDAPPDAAGEEGDAASVDSAVAEALAALRSGDYDAAESTLVTAAESAGPIAARRRLADWRVLADRARDFADYSARALDEVRSGNEFEVNGKPIVVVEKDDRKFVYRFQGRNRAVTPDKIPSGIRLAIVTKWFDARPANHLFLGAWHATKPEPDLARAREEWELAEAGGISAEPLLRLLDDPALAAEAGSDAADAER